MEVARRQNAVRPQARPRPSLPEAISALRTELGEGTSAQAMLQDLQSAEPEDITVQVDVPIVNDDSDDDAYEAGDESTQQEEAGAGARAGARTGAYNSEDYRELIRALTNESDEDLNYEAEDENTQVQTQQEQPRVESEEDTEVVFSQRQQQQQQQQQQQDSILTTCNFQTSGPPSTSSNRCGASLRC